MLQSIAYYENKTQKYWKDENYYGYVYLTYDQKNNRIYIGCSKRKIENSKNYFGSGRWINFIIKKRGTYFLKKFILGVCYSKEELIDCEYECKLFFHSLNEKYGYNIALFDSSPGKGRISFRKGITYEVEFGIEKSKEIKQKQKLKANDPEIKERRVKKYKITLKNNPSILINRNNKISISSIGKKSCTKGKTYEEIHCNNLEKIQNTKYKRKTK